MAFKNSLIPMLVITNPLAATSETKAKRIPLTAMSPRPHNRPSKNGIRREDFLQKIPKTGVDVHPLSVNVFVPIEAGTPSLGSAFYVHFGTAN